MNKESFARLLTRGGLIIGVLVALVVLLQRISSNNMIYLSTDEFGPWATAAWINGDDWSSLTKLIPYYSYNYTFILAAIYRLFDDSHRMYQAAVVFNALTSAAIVPLAYLICRQLDTEQRPLIHLIISLFCALTSFNIVYSNLTCSEAWLVFIYWVVLYVAVRLFSRPSVEGYAGPLFFVFLLMMGYTTHQRFVGVVIAGLLALIFLTIRKKMTLKQLLVVLAAMAVMLLVHRYFKNLVQEEVYLLSQRTGNLGNDYGCYLKNLSRIFTVNDVRYGTFLRFAGSLYYFGASTLLIGYLGLGTAIVRLIRAWKSKQDTQVAFHAFILLGGLFEVLISGIALNLANNRIDYIFYGRYIEIIFGAYIILGWEALLRFWVNKWTTIVVMLVAPIAVFILATLSIQNKVNELLERHLAFQYVNCPAVAAYWRNGLHIDDIATITISLFALLAVMILLLRQVPRTYAHPVAVAVISLAITVNVVNAFYINDKVVLTAKGGYSSRDWYVKMAKKAHKENDDWYFVYHGETYLNNSGRPDKIQMGLSFLQFLLKHKTITQCDYRSLSQEQLKHSNLITADIYPEYVGKYSFNGRNGIFLMKKVKGKDYSSIDFRGFTTKGKRIGKCLRSKKLADMRNSEILLKGPGMGIGKGDYEVLFNCKVLDGQGWIANTNVKTNTAYARSRTDKVITRCSSSLRKENIEGGSNFIQIDLPVHIDKDSAKFNVKMLTNDSLEISDFKIMNRPQSLCYVENEKFSIADRRIGVQEGRKVNNFIQSSGKSGKIVYGPYASLEPGFYELHIPVKLNPSQANRVYYRIESHKNNLDYAYGSLDKSLRPISDDSPLAKELKLTKDEAKSSLREAIIPFVVAQKAEKMEFIIYAKDKVNLCIYDYTLKKAK